MRDDATPFGRTGGRSTRFPAHREHDGHHAGLGYLAGSFDLLNVAHLDVIGQARARCTRLVVGVLPDDEVEQLTGRPPVVPLAERVTLVGHVRGVDEVVEHDPERHRALRPDLTFVVAGEDPGTDVEAVVLEPRRRSSSAVLLAALTPTTSRAVAV